MILERLADILLENFSDELDEILDIVFGVIQSEQASQISKQACKLVCRNMYRERERTLQYTSVLSPPSPGGAFSLSISLTARVVIHFIAHILQEEKEIPKTLVAPGISAELDRLKDVWKSLPSKILEVREFIHA